MEKNPEKKFKESLRWYSRIMYRYRRSDLKIPGLNVVMRWKMEQMHRSKKAKVMRAAKGKEAEIERWSNTQPLFFGFALVRSGTVLLTTILREATEGTVIEHEVNIDDYWKTPKAISQPEFRSDYVNHYRKQEIWHRMADQHPRLYGEINPYLCWFCEPIQEAFPSAKCFHIIRDGRDAVRSVMSREILGPKDPFTKLLRPHPSDPYAARWEQMDRFERVCWMWQAYNGHIRQHVQHRIQFEKLLSDYDYFKTMLGDFLELDLKKKTWERYSENIVNQTPNFAIPRWQDWSPEMTEKFDAICGKEMEAYGYY